MTEYKTMHDALKDVSSFVPYYNFDRDNSAIEYLIPAKFEQLQRRSKSENGFPLETAAPHPPPLADVREDAGRTFRRSETRRTFG